MQTTSVTPKPKRPVVRILCFLQACILPGGVEGTRLFDKETGHPVSFSIGSIEEAVAYNDLIKDIRTAVDATPFRVEFFRQFGTAYVVLSGSAAEIRNSRVTLSLKEDVHYEIRNHSG